MHDRIRDRRDAVRSEKAEALDANMRAAIQRITSCMSDAAAGFAVAVPSTFIENMKHIEHIIETTDGRTDEGREARLIIIGFLTETSRKVNTLSREMLLLTQT